MAGKELELQAGLADEHIDAADIRIVAKQPFVAAIVWNRNGFVIMMSPWRIPC